MHAPRAAARDALLARTSAIGLALTVAASAVTGGVAGLIARADHATAQPEAEEATAPLPVPRPRRTIYVQVRQQPAAEAPPRRPGARRPAASPPRRTVQAPVTRSDGS